MIININNTDIYYEKHILDNNKITSDNFNNDKHNTQNYSDENNIPTLVFLHGWGSNLRVFDSIISDLKADYNIYAIDLSGFGNSPEPDNDWSIYDYADMVKSFILKENIQNPIILGHSFGGRLGIILSNSQNNPSSKNKNDTLSIKKLVLINSAGIIPKRSFSYKYKVGKYKFIKKIKNLKIVDFAFGDIISAYMSKAGSSDYKRASQRMKNILKLAVNEDLSHLMPDINIPTLLIWGDKDTATPLADGQKMSSLIPNSKLVVFEDATHYSFLDKPQEFKNALLNFLREDN